MRLSLVGVVCAFSLTCSSTTAPMFGQLAVKATPPTLKLTNEGPGTVYIFAMEAEFAALANWAPCTDPARCRSVGAGATADLAYTDIAGYSAAAKYAIVYWWQLVPSDGGFAPDSIRTVGAEL